MRRSFGSLVCTGLVILTVRGTGWLSCADKLCIELRSYEIQLNGPDSGRVPRRGALGTYQSDDVVGCWVRVRITGVDTEKPPRSGEGAKLGCREAGQETTHHDFEKMFRARVVHT